MIANKYINMLQIVIAFAANLHCSLSVCAETGYASSLTTNGINIRLEDKFLKAGAGLETTPTVSVVVEATESQTSISAFNLVADGWELPLTQLQNLFDIYDDTHVWIGSDLGRIDDGLILVSIADGTVTRTLRGNHFSLSPSKRHVAFAHVRSGGRLGGILVDNSLVYPCTINGLQMDGRSGPKSSDGRSLFELMPDYDEMSSCTLVTPIIWDGQIAISFMVDCPTTDSASELKSVHISNVLSEEPVAVEELGTTTQLQIRRANAGWAY